MDTRTLIERILADPEDDLPRQIYADFLLDHGDPRGELIALQCRRARERDVLAGHEMQVRIQDLLAEHERSWRAPLDRLAKIDKVEFRRGMIEGVTMSAQEFLDHGRDLFRETPIRRVELTEAAGAWGELMDSPLLERVEELGLDRQQLTTTHMRELADGMRLEHLRVLDLRSNDIDSRGVLALARSRHLGRLEELILSDNVIDDEGALALAENSRLTSLRQLWLAAGNTIGPEGCTALGKLPLRALGLRYNPCGSRGAEALAASPALANLAFLGLDETNLGPAGAWALAASPHLRELEELSLYRNPIGDEGGKALLESPFLPREMLLVVSIGTGIGEEVFRGLQARFRVM